MISVIRIEFDSSGNRIISPESQNFHNRSITLHFGMFVGVVQRFCNGKEQRTEFSQAPDPPAPQKSGHNTRQFPTP